MLRVRISLASASLSPGSTPAQPPCHARTVQAELGYRARVMRNTIGFLEKLLAMALLVIVGICVRAWRGLVCFGGVVVPLAGSKLEELIGYYMRPWSTYYAGRSPP